MAGTLDPNASGEEVVFAVNELLSNPSAGVGGEESEIAFNNAVMIGDTVVFWNGEFLYSMYSASPDGANLTNDYTTVNSSNYYHGLRAGDAPTESTNPADYVWTEIQANRAPYYHVRTGRQVDWEYSEEAVIDFTLDASGGAIDLDAVVVDGMNGEDGNSSRLDIAYATVLDQPVREAQNVAVNTGAKLWTGGTYSVNEQQALGYDNTQGSNLLTGGENEFITIGFDPEFDGGVAYEGSIITLSDLGTSVADDVFSWPTNSATPAVIGTTSAADWEYTPSSVDSSSSILNCSGRLTYIGSESVDFENSSLNVTINVTSLDNADGSSVFVTFSSFWQIGSLSGGAFSSFNSISTPGEYTFSDDTWSGGSTNRILSPGDYIQIYFRIDNSADRPITFEVESVEINTGDSQTTHYDFDIDTFGSHFPGTSGTVDIDFTNAVLNGQPSTSFQGSWILDGIIGVAFGSSPSSSTMANRAFSILSNDSGLRSDVSIFRGTGVGGSFTEDSNGLVVRVSSTSDGFSFWTSFSSAFTAPLFTWDTEWMVTPDIYVDGVEYPVVNTNTSSDATPAAIAGELHTLIGNFPENTISGQLAAQHLHDEIESTYEGVAVSDPIEIAGVGGFLEIDLTNATFESTGFLTGWVIGEWKTNNANSFFISLPKTHEEVVTSIFNATNLLRRSDTTVRRGTGLGDSFIESATGSIIRIDAADNGFTFVIAGTGTGTTFSWNSRWEVLPTIYVNGIEYPTIDTISATDGTPRASVGVISEIQIVIDTGITDDVSDASLTITENSGRNTEPLTFLVSDGATSIIGDHTTYIVRSTDNSEITMFSSSRTDADVSDLPFIRSSIVNAVNEFTESPVNFTATDDTTGNRLIFTADTPEPIEGNITVEVQNSGGDGNVIFTPSTIAEGVSPIEVTGPTLSLTAPGSNIGVEYTPFSGDSISTEKNFEEIAIDIRTNFDPADWGLGGLERNILFVKDVGGIVAGEWDIVVSDYGTSVTDPSIFNDNSFVTSIVTPGESLVGSIIYSSGRLTTGDYTQAVAGPTSNYRAERVVNWMPPTPEPEVSTTVGDYSFNRWVTEGDTIDLRIDLSNGNTFRNNQGSTELKTTILINGIEATENDHSLYDYKWTYQGNTICVDNNRNVLDDNGLPLTATFDDDNNLVCSLGSPADSTISPALGATLRRINAGAEEVTNATQFVCDVSNI